MRIVAAAVVLVSLAIPASAHAQNAQVSVGGSPGVVTYTGSEGVDNFFVSINNPPAWIFNRNSAAAALMTAGSGCNDVFADGTRLACQITGGATINLNGGDDFVGGGGDGHGLTVSGGAGNDTIVPSGNAIHTLNGNAGNDTINLSVTPNQDIVDGGADDDLIRIPRGPDDIRGGSGVDTVEFSVAGATVSVTLNDVQDDGASNDTDSNIRSDVENLLGGEEQDNFTGSAAANVLTGGGGNDNLDGAGGQDTIVAGDGDDTVEARDGAADSVNCGVGNDSARVDPLDTVSGCETVSLPDDDGDGVTAPQDCNDNDISIKPGAVDKPGDGIDQDCSNGDAPAPPPPGPVDGDGDGSLPPADCDDANAARHPGATDVPGDGVDQDCSNGDATPPDNPALVQNQWLIDGDRTRVLRLRVRKAPAGTKVTVKCTGRGCPFARKTRSSARGGVVVLTGLFGRALRPGAVIEIRITARGFKPKTVSYTIRRGKIPRARIR
jgi:Putative metal-binding motif/RTX calcium-binding nonapeptide repeat (4 copies)